MKPSNNKKTHTPNGEPLSDIFIGEDGILSVYHQDNECEVIGFTSNVLFDAFVIKLK